MNKMIECVTVVLYVRWGEKLKKKIDVTRGGTRCARRVKEMSVSPIQMYNPS